MLIKTVKKGNVVIRVHDDSYAGKSEAEIQTTIDEYCRFLVSVFVQQEKIYEKQ